MRDNIRLSKSLQTTLHQSQNSLNIFWQMFTARRYASAVYMLYGHLSVRPSVTSRRCPKAAKHIITL